MRAPKARAKILGYFPREQHITSSFSNSRGGGATTPGCPSPPGAYVSVFLAKQIYKKKYSVTSRNCDVNNNAHLLVAGFGDGGGRLYEARVTTNDGKHITPFRDHSSSIVATHGGSKVGEHTVRRFKKDLVGNYPPYNS